MDFEAFISTITDELYPVLKRALELNDQNHDSYIFVERIFDTSR